MGRKAHWRWGVVLGMISAGAAAGPALEARVFVSNQCPASLGEGHYELFGGPIAAAILADLASKAAEGAVDYAANRLTTIAEPTLEATTRLKGFYLKGNDGQVRLNPDVGCLTLVIDDEFAKPAKLANPKLLPDGGYADVMAKLDRKDPDYQTLTSMANARATLVALGVSKVPKVYLEMTVETQRGYFSLNPQLLYYPAFVMDKPWFGKQAKDVEFVFTFMVPGSNSEKFTLAFKDSLPGTLNSVRATAKMLPWAPLVGSPQPGSEAGLEVPLNLSVSLIERGKPSAFGSYLGQSVAAHREEVGSTVKDQVLYAVSPAARLATRTTAYQGAAEAQGKYSTALSDFFTAKAESEALAGKTGAKATQAQLKYSLAEQNLNLVEQATKMAFEVAGVPFTPVDRNVNDSN